MSEHVDDKSISNLVVNSSFQDAVALARRIGAQMGELDRGEAASSGEFRLLTSPTANLTTRVLLSVVVSELAATESSISVQASPDSPASAAVVGLARSAYMERLRAGNEKEDSRSYPEVSSREQVRPVATRTSENQARQPPRSLWVLQIVGGFALFGSFYLDGYTVTTYYFLTGSTVTRYPYLAVGVTVGLISIGIMAFGLAIEKRWKKERLRRLANSMSTRHL